MSRGGMDLCSKRREEKRREKRKWGSMSFSYLYFVLNDFQGSLRFFFLVFLFFSLRKWWMLWCACMNWLVLNIAGVCHRNFSFGVIFVRAKFVRSWYLFFFLLSS